MTTQSFSRKTAAYHRNQCPVYQYRTVYNVSFDFENPDSVESRYGVHA